MATEDEVTWLHSSNVFGIRRALLLSILIISWKGEDRLVAGGGAVRFPARITRRNRSVTSFSLDQSRSGYSKPRHKQVYEHRCERT